MLRKAILKELKRRGWSRYRLIEECGVSKTVVYEFLAGKREIGSSALERICKALGMTLRNLTDGS